MMELALIIPVATGFVLPLALLTSAAVHGMDARRAVRVLRARREAQRHDAA